MFVSEEAGCLNNGDAQPLQLLVQLLVLQLQRYIALVKLARDIQLVARQPLLQVLKHQT